MSLAWLLCLLMPAGAIDAEPYLPLDRPLRNDLQLLNDAGVLNLPLSTWPIPAASVASLREADLSSQPDGVRGAHARVLRELDRRGASVELRAANELNPRTHFGDQPINRYETRVAYGWQGERFGGRLQGNLARDADNEDTEAQLDGSYLAMSLGNWLFSAGAQDRWWGPGWEGSLILGDNARPVPSVAFDRLDTSASESAWLSWLGPWSFSGFFGQLESNRDDAARTKLFGFRFVFRPLDGLELGLSRTAQWGGKGRPEDWSSFWNALIGRSNQGDDDPDLEGGDANQFAGYDFRWASPIGSAPYALYGQLIGIDEAGYLPYKFIGLGGVEFWGTYFGRQARLNVEVANTEVEFYKSERGGLAYVHSFYTDGYRHRRRVLGHSMDGEGLMVSAGAQWVDRKGDAWHLLTRRTDQNKIGGTNRAFGVEEEAAILGLELTHARERGPHKFVLSLGAEHIDPAEGDSELEPRVWGSYERRF